MASSSPRPQGCPFIPPSPEQLHQQINFIVLPSHGRRPRNWSCCWVVSAATAVLVMALAFLLWPSNPHLKIQRMKLLHLRVHFQPHVSIDMAMGIKVRIRNVDVYSMDYNWMRVEVAYRGKKLGNVKSEKGHVRARGSSEVDAVLELSGVRVLNVLQLLEDLAEGLVPLDTVTDITGQLGLYYTFIPLKASVACKVLINTLNQTIDRQQCYRRPPAGPSMVHERTRINIWAVMQMYGDEDRYHIHKFEYMLEAKRGDGQKKKKVCRKLCVMAACKLVG